MGYTAGVRRLFDLRWREGVVVRLGVPIVEISAWLLTRTKKCVFVGARYKHVKIQ